MITLTVVFVVASAGMLAGAVPPPASPSRATIQPCESVMLVRPPVAFFTAAWAPGDEEVLVADVRGDRVLRFQRNGTPAGEVSFTLIGGVRAPRVSRNGTSVWVVSSSTRLLSLDGIGLVPRLVADLGGLSFPDGTTLVAIRSAKSWHDDIVANMIVKASNGERIAGLARFTLSPLPAWEPIFPVPQISAAGVMVDYYRDIIAPAGGSLYSLEYGEPARIHEVLPKRRPLRAFPAGLDKLPPFPVGLMADEAALQSAANIRATPTPVGLYVQGRYLYLATREPAPLAATTWRLHRIDPVADKLLGSLTLPTTAADLLVLPGDEYWALIEKGPYRAGFVHDTLGMVLIPAATIQAQWPAGSHEVGPCATAPAGR